MKKHVFREKYNTNIVETMKEAIEVLKKNDTLRTNKPKFVFLNDAELDMVIGTKSKKAGRPKKVK